MTTISSTSFSNIRTGVLGLAGAISLLYGALALWQGRPDPMSPWLPGLSGFAALLIIWVSARMAGRANARQASDELFCAQWRGAVRIGYWVALLLYPVFALLLVSGITGYATAFATMGTMTGAASLLSFVYLTLSTR